LLLDSHDLSVKERLELLATGPDGIGLISVGEHGVFVEEAVANGLLLEVFFRAEASSSS